MAEAIKSEQKTAGNITYTSVTFGYNESKVPTIRVDGEFRLFNFNGTYSLSIKCDGDNKTFFKKLGEMIAQQTCKYVYKAGGKKLRADGFQLVKDNPKVGKVVYSRIYSRFGKSRCLITNRSGDSSKLTLDKLVNDSFKGSCIIRLYQAFNMLEQLKL